jgi:hypothetical protein
MRRPRLRAFTFLPAAVALVVAIPPQLQPVLAEIPRWAKTSDPNRYEGSIGTMLAYDQAIHDRTYDDGYDATAHLQFEAELARHGTWVDTTELGRVWIPSTVETGSDFWPYRTGGHWVLTEYGWTWSSDWTWGRIAFHYGRWAYLPKRGWCWVAGTLWGPAWVAWRQGKQYLAWAPLPPKGMNLARPLGTLSPWWMVRARTLGATPEFVPRRSLPALFSLTAAVSNPRELTLGTLVARVNVGPMGPRCCAPGLRPTALSTSAPNAAPPYVVRPVRGAPVSERPWVRAGFRDQAPLCRWPGPGIVADPRCPDPDHRS